MTTFRISGLSFTKLKAQLGSKVKPLLTLQGSPIPSSGSSLRWEPPLSEDKTLQMSTNRPEVDSPAALALLTSHGRWRLTPHLQLLDEALVYLDAREAPAWWLRGRLHYDLGEGVDDNERIPFTRLIVEMPPRHGKSEMVSRYFPAWYLGRHPQQRVILCSYEATLAAKWGAKVRDLMKEWGAVVFGASVKKDHAARFDWEIEGGDGGMVTAGVGGAITGYGADLGIIDDAIKNAEEAASPTIQKRNAEWFDSTFYTRLEPESICVDMGTRWHAADLTGHILSLQEQEEDDREDEGDDEFWFRIRLPALAEADDLLGRAEGEALWPDRFPEGRLRRMARRIGDYFFGALYQQRPTNAAGQIFKVGWWQYYSPAELPDEAREPIWGGIFADTAGWDDLSTTTDFAAIAVIVRVGHDLYWRHASRGRWTFPQFQQRLRDYRDEYGLPIIIEQTPWANPLIQSMAQELGGVVPFVIGGHSKVTRAMAASPYAASGNFYIPRGAPWVGPFVSEHADFPTGAHDDWVDTTSMAALRLLVGVGQIDYTPPRTRRLTYKAPPEGNQAQRRPGQLPPLPGQQGPGGRTIGGRA